MEVKDHHGMVIVKCDTIGLVRDGRDSCLRRFTYLHSDYIFVEIDKELYQDLRSTNQGKIKILFNKKGLRAYI